MPDVFVPLDTLKYTRLHRQLAAKSIVINNYLKYVDANRKQLRKQWKTFEDLPLVTRFRKPFWILFLPKETRRRSHRRTTRSNNVRFLIFDYN